ncbi:MAG: hypothetical protein ABFC71_09950 [Methanoregula sp.]
MAQSKEIIFDTVKEDWNIYRLEDNTVVKLKIILLRIIQEEVHVMGVPPGIPMGGMQINNVVAIIPPEDLRHLKEIEPIYDIKYETVKENWNEYVTDDGFVIRIKPNISQIDRLGKIDPRGDPLYGVNMQPTVKRMPGGK